VAAVGAADLLRRLPDARALPVVGATALAVGVGAQVAVQPTLLAAEYETDARFAPVFDWLAETIPAKASVAAVGYTDHVSARTLEWWLARRPGAAWRDHDVYGLNSERIFDSPRKFEDWMTKPRSWGDADWQSVVVEFAVGPASPDRAMVLPATAAMWREAVRKAEGRLVPLARRRFNAVDLDVVVWRDTAPPPHAR
jgi:hypothetical protein